MRPAPAVAVRCGGAAQWRALQALLHALAAASLAAFVLLHLEQPAWPALVVALVAAGAAWHLLQEAPRELRWDGQVWSLDAAPGQLGVMIDLGPALLLRLRPTARGGARWLAVTRREAGAAWHPLRAALYSRPPETSTPRVRPSERPAAD